MKILKCIKFLVILSTFAILISGLSALAEENGHPNDDHYPLNTRILYNLTPRCKSRRCYRQVESHIERRPFGISERGRCECALFSINTEVGLSTKPVVAKETIEIPCTKEGQDTCEKLCVEIAKAAQTQGPIIVCDAAKDIQNLIMRLYTRVCNSKDWTYSGIESTDELCCENGLPVKCGNQNVPGSLSITEDS